MIFRFQQCFRILSLLLGLNIIYLLVLYHSLILKTSLFTDVLVSPVSKAQRYNEDLTDDSSICYIPRFYPWDQTAAKVIHIEPIVRCPTNKPSLIDVINYTQLAINQSVNRTFYAGEITHCVYMVVDRNPEEHNFCDWSYTLSEPVIIVNGRTNPINNADFVLTRCYNNQTVFLNGSIFWYVLMTINRIIKERGTF